MVPKGMKEPDYNDLYSLPLGSCNGSISSSTGRDNKGISERTVRDNRHPRGRTLTDNGRTLGDNGSITNARGAPVLITSSSWKI